MSLTQILVFTLLSLLAATILPYRWRMGFILLSSLVAVYWMQPSTPIRHLDFWLPTASVLLTVFVWVVTTESSVENQRNNLVSVTILAIFVSVVSLSRYLEPICCLTPTRPPGFLTVVVALLVLGIVSYVFKRFFPNKRILASGMVIILLALFVSIKTEFLAQKASSWLRHQSGQEISLASSLDLPWLGFSYLAFRLLHVLRDHRNNKLMPMLLGEFVVYVLFFPSLTAGPIDRAQHFISELRRSMQKTDGCLTLRNLIEGGKRLLMGVFKKFVLADSLAIFSLNSQNAVQVEVAYWMWVLLYAYAFRIYFDFAGYTDIAIGMGRLLGINLPENFEKPYLKPNLTAFWNSWHITLAQWFRAYFFNPLTRALRSRYRNLPVWVIIFTGQLLTMLLIGLWHGVTWNFAAWGVWHGVGLFIHNRWSDWAGPRLGRRDIHPLLKQALQIGGWGLNFHFITLGWVWFALPDIDLSWQVMLKLFGF